MKPLLLTLSAFGPYAGEQVLDFAELKGRTFFLIHGPTGAGKTTILDAICFALYGDTSGSLRDSKSVRSDHAALETMTMVEFTFSVGLKRYRIRRMPEQARPKKRGDGVTIKAAEAVLYEIKGETEELLETGYSDVTKKVETLLGFKSSQFRQVVLLPQGDFRKLLTANSSERQEIMQTLFKTELYRQIEEHLKNKAGESKKQYEELQKERQWILNETGLTSLAELVAQLKDGQMRLAAAEQQRLALAAKLAEAQRHVNDGLLVEAKFTEVVAAGKLLAKLTAKAPLAEEGRATLTKAQQAAQLADVEAQLLQCEKTRISFAEKRQVQEKQLAQWTHKLNTAEKTYTAENGKSEERQAAVREVLRLDEFIQKSHGLADATRKLAEQKELEAVAARQKKSAAEALLATKMLLEEKMLQEKALRELAAKADGAAAALEKGKRLAQRRQILMDAEKDGKKTEQALAIAQKQLTDLEQKQMDLQKALTLLQHLFATGQAAILAKELETGQPCPVCGSAEHPSLARSSERLPSEAELKTLQQSIGELEKTKNAQLRKVNQLLTELQSLNSRKADIMDELGAQCGMPPEELTAEVTVLTAAYIKAKQAAEDLQGLVKALALLKEKETAQTKAQEAAETLWQASDRDYQSAWAVVTEREAMLPEEYRDSSVLLAAKNLAVTKQVRLQACFEAAQKTLQECSEGAVVAKTDLAAITDNLKRAEESCAAGQLKFSERLQAAGFSDLVAYQAAIKPPAHIEKLANRIVEFDREMIAAKDRKRRAEAATVNLIAPDLAQLEGAAGAAAAAHHAALKEETQVQDIVKKQEAQRKKLEKLETELEKINAVYSVIGRLAEVANGANAHKLTFQRFVLGSLLEDVAAAANLRLKIMSRGRYLLQRTMDRARKNAAGGLDLEVFDNYTGVARGVATLSGGETFLASLSLALGLADVVQSYAGGIHLDTILVDEGFGTLDPESLDIAIRALVDLQKGGRLVGIISHVPELKERIDARLAVSRAKHGSTACFHVG